MEIQQRKATEIELGVKSLIFKLWFSYILAMQTLGLVAPTQIGSGPQKKHCSGSGLPSLCCHATGLSPLSHQIGH